MKKISPDQAKTIVVGMSGGVDSSVVAAMLKKQGHRVIGLFMRNWEETDEQGHCSATQDFQDVQRVCEHLDIPYYTVNYAKEYFDHVFQYVIDTYQLGETPNPDVLCNREIKFSAFYQYAMELGADYLATGHYCRRLEKDGEYYLGKGIDGNKDQSYFLCSIDPTVLGKVLFPLGEYTKEQVRAFAKDWGLSTFEKKDSTGLCFIGERKFRPFLNQYIHTQNGPFVDWESGKRVGEHLGQCFYTIGQRKGLGLGGAGEPWFVVKKDRETNEVFVIRGKQHPELYKKQVQIADFNWLAGPPAKKFQCQAKIRYRQPDTPCEVELTDDGNVQISFLHKQWAVAKAQFTVLYLGDTCLGGGAVSGILEKS
jgi:tRNA-specific 2-thiouridylase